MQVAGAMDRDSDRSALLPALRDMFPTMPDDVLTAALDAYGNDVEDAIGALLEMCAESIDGSALTVTTGGVTRGEQQHSSQEAKVEVKTIVRPTSGNSASSGKHPASSSATPSQKRGSNSRPRRAGAAASQPPPPSQRTTWGQLRTDHQLQTQGAQLAQRPHQSYGASTGHCPKAAWPLGQLPSGYQSPKYIVPGAAAGIRLGATDFPDLSQLADAAAASGTTAPAPQRGAAGSARGTRLTPAAAAAPEPLPVARSSSTMTPSYSAGSLYDLAQQVGSLSFTSVSSAGRGATAPAAPALPPSPPPPRRTQASIPFGYADVARHVPPQQQQQPVRPEVGSWAWLAGQGDVYGAGDVYGTDDVYGAGDAPAADEGWQAAVLEELRRSHPWAGSDLVEAVCLALQYDLTEVVDALDELNAASYQYDDSGSAAASFNSNYPAADSSSSSSEVEDEARENPSPPPRHGRAAAAAAESFDFSAQRGCPGGRADGASAASGSRRRDEPPQPSDGADAYSRHRGAALKLTHMWRKQMGKASAAFTAGDRALGRRLVAEAQGVRRQAAAAHQQAAEGKWGK